jgi:hypothetical protein
MACEEVSKNSRPNAKLNYVDHKYNSKNPYGIV